MRIADAVLRRCRRFGNVGDLTTYLCQGSVASLAKSDDRGMVSRNALLTHEAADQGFRFVHGESGFNGTLPGGVHDFRAGLVVQEPAFALVNGRAVHDGDTKQVVAIVGLLNEHELTCGSDREFFLRDSLFEVVGERTQKEAILYPRGSMVREGAYLALREVLFFTKYSHGFRFFERIHVQPHEVLGQGRYFVHVFGLVDASRDGRIAEELAGGEPAASGDQTPAAAFAGGDYDSLKQAMLSDAFRELIHALIGDGIAEGGSIHVNLIEPDVLFHRAGLRWFYFDRVKQESQRCFSWWFSPHSPLSNRSS